MSDRQDIHVTPGQDTIRRFRYQLEYVVLRWLDSLSDSGVSVVSELDEDLEVIQASVARERIQVKTMSSGAWTVRQLLPILKRFGDQFIDDESLTFKLVSNALGNEEVQRLSAGLELVRRSGTPTSNQRKTIRQTAARLYSSADGDALLRSTSFELGKESMDSLAAVIRDRLHRICEERYDAATSTAHLDALYDRLLAVVFQRSSSSYLGDRTLTATELDQLLSIEIARIPLPRGTNLAQLGRNVAALAAGRTPLPSPVQDDEGDIRKPRGLGEEGEARRKELQSLLSDPNRQFSPHVKAEQRMELARLLWDDAKADEAEAQCAIAIGEAQSDPGAFAFVIHDCSNFLARRRPQSALLLPHLDAYFDSVRSHHWLWVDGMEVAAYATARGRLSRNYIQELTGFLSAIETQDFDDLISLHWNEALALGQAFGGESDRAVSHFRSVLKLVDADRIHNYSWLRRIFLLTERFLRKSPEFDVLLSEFSAFFESKDAWGERADLHKEIALARFRDDLHEGAIPLFRTASEGYFRAGAYEGYLLARMLMAACYEKTGKPLAAIKEYLSAANAADLLNIRKHTIRGLREAIPIAFNSLGLTLDALLWSITYYRLVSVIGSHEQVLEGQTNLDHVFALLALKRTSEETSFAKALITRYVSEGDDPGMFDLFEGAVHATDTEWEVLLSKETEAVRKSVASMRESAKNAENLPEPTTISTTVGGLVVRASWPEDYRFKWLALGLISWFELYGPDLAAFFVDFTEVIEIECVSEEDASWAVETYPVAKAMAEKGLPAVLVGISPNGPARLVLAVTESMLNRTKDDVDDWELPTLVSGVALLRALFLGQSQAETMADFERQFLAPKEFEIAANGRLAAVQYHFGGFMVEDGAT